MFSLPFIFYKKFAKLYTYLSINRCKVDKTLETKMFMFTYLFILCNNYIFLNRVHCGSKWTKSIRILHFG